jgi:hypothetical protein
MDALASEDANLSRTGTDALLESRDASPKLNDLLVTVKECSGLMVRAAY